MFFSKMLRVLRKTLWCPSEYQKNSRVGLLDVMALSSEGMASFVVAFANLEVLSWTETVVTEMELLATCNPTI